MPIRISYSGLNFHHVFERRIFPMNIRLVEWLTNERNRDKELKKISTSLRQNGYQRRTISKAISKQQQPQQRVQDETQRRSIAVLPYIKGVTDKIGRILRKHDISTAYKPDHTIGAILRNPKQKITLENQGAYSVACGSCSLTYVGQTNRRISARLEEHRLAIRNKQPTSALFQHQHQTGDKIDFGTCKQIANIPDFRTRIIREAIEIEKSGHLNTRDDALHLSNTWRTIIKQQSDAQQPTGTSQLRSGEINNATIQGAEPAPPTHKQHRYHLQRRV
ncbi:uncharacterized protein LOC132707891 [Cylas formicarius]|uniref:uncharacterized protein LOC132707891 n=1 Tax=Cylas formicarius TaxID=197179 RepID=UPI00295874EB|nr:uncharacterized protein LOC132707891 [Cylas formicarius]